jgi:2-phospho-L-lactate guanylyltransferase
VTRLAIIPVKALAQAKMRLAGVLDGDARTSLVLAMVEDVLAACRESGLFGRVIVVSGDAAALDRARAAGADGLAEPRAIGGLNDALRFAIDEAVERGASEAVVLPADLPCVRADDLARVVSALGEDGGAVVVVPSRDGGTNALALRPPHIIAPAFGPGSAAAHLAAAHAARARVAALTLDALAFDVDAPADLRELAARDDAAPATARWLARYGAAFL